MIKWVLIAAGLAGCATLVYVGVTHPALVRQMTDVKSLMGGLKKAVPAPTSESVSADQLAKAKESVAESLARQQEMAQQVQQSTLQSMAEVQRTLRSIEDINRINRQTQQFKPPPTTNR